jgi:hypothetical protein
LTIENKFDKLVVFRRPQVPSPVSLVITSLDKGPRLKLLV